MVLTRIRHADALKPQVKVRELRAGQAGMPTLIKRAMELTDGCSIYNPLYKRRESL